MDDEVRIVTAAQTPTAVVAETTSWEEFPRVWRALLAEVWAYVRGSDLTPGRNVMLYKDDSPNVEVGVEVSGSFMGSGRVVPSSLPAGRAAVAVARGEPSPAKLAKSTPPCASGAPRTAMRSPGFAGRSTATGSRIRTRRCSRRRSTGCWSQRANR